MTGEVAAGEVARVVGFARREVTDPGALSRNAPAFYADPAAWLVAAALDGALESGQVTLPDPADDVAMLVAGSVGTTRTIDALRQGAARGVISPLRFAGGNPAVLAGLSCLTRRLRGPSLLLAMDPWDAVPVAATVAVSWLVAGHASHVVVATHHVIGGRESVRCVVLAAAACAQDRIVPHAVRQLLLHQLRRLLLPDPRQVTG
ncbi:MAG: polyketide synthase [Actinobacteria bacterium]|nr:polyketide synthase [Actinomycetota bacterium]